MSLGLLQLTDKLYKAVELGDVEVVREWMNKGQFITDISNISLSIGLLLPGLVTYQFFLNKKLIIFLVIFLYF